MLCIPNVSYTTAKILLYYNNERFNCCQTQLLYVFYSGKIFQGQRYNIIENYYTQLR